MEEKDGNENIFGKNCSVDNDIQNGIWKFKFQNYNLKTKINDDDGRNILDIQFENEDKKPKIIYPSIEVDKKIEKKSKNEINDLSDLLKEKEEENSYKNEPLDLSEEEDSKIELNQNEIKNNIKNNNFRKQKDNKAPKNNTPHINNNINFQQNKDEIILLKLKNEKTIKIKLKEISPNLPLDYNCINLSSSKNIKKNLKKDEFNIIGEIKLNIGNDNDLEDIHISRAIGKLEGNHGNMKKGSYQYEDYIQTTVGLSSTNYASKNN